MKYVEEFRDPKAAKALLAAIARVTDQIGATKDAPVRIMEICGGHTHAIFRYGLDKLVHEGIEFIHGPGCPVCVLPMARVDECIEIAERPEVIFTTFGDAMRVPGARGSLLQAKSRGADVRTVYSPLDALELARRNPEREVVFFGLGFETTTPSTALSIQQAAREGLTNFTVFCNHITVPPPLKALLDDPMMQLDGFVGPGHVSMVIGVHPYDFIADDYGKPLVVAGFEPLDLLQSVLMVLTQIRDGRAEIENQYARVVPEHGNPVSLAAIADVYELRPSFEWRGLGEIDASGLRIRDRYLAYDAETKFGIGYAAAGGRAPVAEPEGCSCGAVMTGRMKPTACAQFGRGCTPDTPLGALMVSSEGACAAYWTYGGARLMEPAE
jgi:hydrogenase expression/formation protein HypD